MTYQEAAQLCENYQDLIDTNFGRKTISHLLIVPMQEIGIPKLVYNYVNQISSASFYENYQEFEVWVIFDIEDWERTAVLTKMRLSKLLEANVQAS